MRHITILLLVLSVVTGCAIPPKPRECQGEFRPVNSIENKSETERGPHG